MAATDLLQQLWPGATPTTSKDGSITYRGKLSFPPTKDSAVAQALHLSDDSIFLVAPIMEGSGDSAPEFGLQVQPRDCNADVVILPGSAGQLDQDLTVTICYELDPDWRFSQSFSSIPGFLDHALDSLDISDAKYIYLTNQAHQISGNDQHGPVMLECGLNFVSSWTPNGVAGLFLDLTTRTPLTVHARINLSGSQSLSPLKDDYYPWDEPDRVQGIHLKIDLGGGMNLPETETIVSLTKPALRMYSPLSLQTATDNSAYHPIMAYEGLLAIPGLELIDRRFTALLQPDANDEIALTAELDLNIEHLLNLFGVVAKEQDPTNLIPEDLTKALGQINLRAVSVDFSKVNDRYQVGGLGFTIRFQETGGATNSWAPMGDLFSAKLNTIRVLISSPFDSQVRSTFISINGRLELLGIQLDATIELPGPRITAQGSTNIDFKTILKHFDLEVVGAPTIALEHISLLVLPASKQYTLAITGQTYDLGDGYTFPAVHLTLSETEWQLECTADTGQRGIPIVKLVEKLSQQWDMFSSFSTTGLDDLTIDAFAIAYGQIAGFDDCKFLLSTRGSLTLSADTMLAASLDIAIGDTKKYGAGSLIIGSNEFDLYLEIAESGNRLIASWREQDGQALTLHMILEDLGFMLDELEGGAHLQEFDLGLTEVDLIWDGQHNLFILDATSSDGGNAFLAASYKDGSAGLAMGITMNRKSLSDVPVIGSDLTNNGYFDIGDFCLILSTFDYSGFTLPPLPNHNAGDFPILGSQAVDLKKGLKLVTKANLGSNGSESGKMLTNVLGDNTNDLLLVVDITSPPDLELQLGKLTIEVDDHTKLTLRQVQLSLKLDPFEGKLSGTIDIPINGITLTATGAFDVSTTKLDAQFQLNATSADGKKASLPIPMGLKGVSLDDLFVMLGLKFEPPSAYFGLGGSFHILGQPLSANQFAFILALEGELPDPLLLLLYIDTLDMDTLTTAFNGAPDTSLPSVVRNIHAYDLWLFYCQEPTQLPTGRSISPGFGFSGFVDLYGWKAFADFTVSSTEGVHAVLQMSPLKIAIGDVTLIELRGLMPPENAVPGQVPPIDQWIPTPPLVLDAHQDPQDPNRWIPVQKNTLLAPVEYTGIKPMEIIPGGGPYFELNSRHSPYINTSMSITFLMLEATVHLEVTDEGFDFDLIYDLAGVEHLVVDCHLNKTGFEGSADFTLGIDHAFNFEILGTTFSLPVKAGLELSMSLKIAHEFRMVLHGEFWFEGLRLSFPTLIIDFPISDLKDLPEIILKHMEDLAEEIFSDIVDEARKLLEEGEKFFEDIGEDAKRLGEQVLEAASNEAKEIEIQVEGLAQKVEQEIVADTKALEESIATVAVETEKEIEVLEDDVVQTIDSIDKEIERIGQSIVDEFNEIKAAADHIIQALEEQITTVEKEIEQEVQYIEQEAAKVVKAIEDGIQEAIDAVWKEAKELGDSIAKEAEQVWDEVKNLATKVWDGITSAANTVAHGISSAWHTIFG